MVVHLLGKAGVGKSYIASRLEAVLRSRGGQASRTSPLPVRMKIAACWVAITETAFARGRFRLNSSETWKFCSRVRKAERGMMIQRKHSGDVLILDEGPIHTFTIRKMDSSRSIRAWRYYVSRAMVSWSAIDVPNIFCVVNAEDEIISARRLERQSTRDLRDGFKEGNRFFNQVLHKPLSREGEHILKRIMSCSLGRSLIAAFCVTNNTVDDADEIVQLLAMLVSEVR